MRDGNNERNDNTKHANLMWFVGLFINSYIRLQGRQINVYDNKPKQKYNYPCIG